MNVNQYHVTVDDIVWCTVALGLWGTGFKHTHTLNLPKTHSPIYIHRQKHIEIKYIQHHRIIHEIKSSLFSIVCTIYDWLIFDWALSTRTRLLWKMWRKNDWINEKKSNFTLLIERVWPQKCLNMLVSISRLHCAGPLVRHSHSMTCIDLCTAEVFSLTKRDLPIPSFFTTPCKFFSFHKL